MDNPAQASELAVQSSLTHNAGEPADSLVAQGEEFPDELLQELLGGTPEGQSATSDGEGEPQGIADDLTLNALADAAGGADKLYKLTVSLPDEQGTASIEELKADATAYRKGQARETELQTERTDFSNQKLKYAQELQQVVTAIGPEALSDERMAPVRQFFAQQQQTEDRILAASVPDWEERVPEIGAFLSSEYGAPQGALEMPAPAWARKALYDWHQFNQRLQAVAEKRKPSKAQATKRNPVTSRTDRISSAIAKAKAGGDPIDAIAALLTPGD